MNGEWPSDSTSPSGEWIARYLRLLGVEREAPSLAALRRLTRAHVLAVPFENITALRRRRGNLGRPVPPPDPEALLTSWGQEQLGGVCFDITLMAGRLLAGLGYRARPVMGTISFAGSHQCVQVELDGERFLVDVGNGAPFFAPIPVQGEPVVRAGGLAYRFRPGEEPETCWQDRGIGGVWTPFCCYDLGPPDLAIRESAYQRHHTPGQSWVVDSLTLIRCEPEQVLSLRDDELTRFTPDGKQRVPMADYGRLLREEFGLPNFPIDEGLQAWQELRRARGG